MAVKSRYRIAHRVVPGSSPAEVDSGTAKVCIHLFVRDDANGRFTESHVLEPLVENGEVVRGKVVGGPARGRLACDPQRDVRPISKSGVVTITMRTDDWRAVTCPKCQATDDFMNMSRGG